MKALYGLKLSASPAGLEGWRHHEAREGRTEALDLFPDAVILGISQSSVKQGEHQHPRGNQEKQERRDGCQAAEEEGMKETEFCNVQIEFSTVIHE